MLRLPALRRALTAAAARAASSSSTALLPAPAALVELRSYIAKPEHQVELVEAFRAQASLRHRVQPAYRCFLAPETGGCTHEFLHLYFYDDLAQRDSLRAKAAQDEEWRRHLAETRAYMQHQESMILKEVPHLYEALGLSSAAHYKPDASRGAGVYELRTYKLLPGYDSVPQLVDAFAQGFPAKLAARRQGELVMLAYSDIGLLNTFIELWRHDSMQASIEAREASRGVAEWRTCVQRAAQLTSSFQTQILKPVPTLSLWT